MSPDETLGETQAGADVSTEPRRPYWAVGLVLLAAVLVVLAAAFLLDRQLRPRVGIEATATTPALAQASTPPTAAPSPTVPAAATPTAPAAAAPTVVASPTGLPVASSPLEREIEAAYERYLRVYSDAVLNLDTSHLSEVLDGKALQLVTDEVNELKAKGRPVKIIEDDRAIALSRVTDTSATLVDEYTSRSVFADPNTKQPLPRTGPPTRIRQSYEFRKIDGVWKIVDGTREVLGEANR